MAKRAMSPFANGTMARELLVDCDDERRRLVYAVVSERVK
jgi:hypothetical protein